MSELLKTITREHKLAGKLGPIFVASPQLELACSRLADFMGNRFIGEEEPLIKEMLLRALDRYKESRKQGDQAEAFLLGLFEHAERLYQRRHVAKAGDKYFVWLPMIESLTQFETKYCECEIETIAERCPDVITPSSATFQLAARTLPGELFRRFFEVHFLETHDESHGRVDSEAVAH